MPLSTEQMQAATAAQRLLADEALRSVLTRIVEDAAQKAMFGDEPAMREANRQLVLAISRLRGELQADADLPKSVQAADAEAKAFE